MQSVEMKRINEALDNILNNIKKGKTISGSRYIIGDPEGAHLRDFDHSHWRLCADDAYMKGVIVPPLGLSDEVIFCAKDQGITWMRFDVKVPAQIEGIETAGSPLRLSSIMYWTFRVPSDVYVDGELVFSERTWMDFKIPEVYLTKEAVPGQAFKVAIRMDYGSKCYYDFWPYVEYIFDRVEDVEFELNSFKEELRYASQFDTVRDILSDVIQMIERSIIEPFDIKKLLSNIQLSREMLSPMKEKAKEHIIHLVGHAHIDMNWFWSMEETFDLIKRDFSTMVGIMEEIPDFKFSQSQCYTYDIAEKMYPDVFKKMTQFIKAGNWDVTASTWVEGDMNIASGESIARHILYSKKHLRNKFNVDPKIMWSPDTFGHSANVPQICKKGGIDYYFMMRCGRGPIFWWEGIDGSRLLAYHMDYTNDINPSKPLKLSETIKSSYGLNNSMYVYGVGDHGGGPTRRDLRRAKQLNSYPTMPKLKFSTTGEFFESVILETSEAIPVETGEMNFIFEGCYTTHSDIKRFNRQGENRLYDAETLGTVAGLLGAANTSVEIEDCWKTVLFNQFHDLFDGSSIDEAYNYSRSIGEKALDTIQSLSQKALQHISSSIKTTGEGIPYIVFNTIGWTRNECLRIKKPNPNVQQYSSFDSSGNELLTQTGTNEIFVHVPDIPSLGYMVIYLKESANVKPFTPIKEDRDYLSGKVFLAVETEFYSIGILKASGEIINLFDKRSQKHIKGDFNTLKLYFEEPHVMSSWDIGKISCVRSITSGAELLIKEDGPVVKILNFKHQIENSIIEQDIIIYCNSPRIDFVNRVEWNEIGNDHKPAPMLKVAFTPNIKNKTATYDIPFGAIERPATDMEVPALKWADISDEQYGLSLLNDCKHGHRVTGNIMELTLIRSGYEPDPTSDIGIHHFTYAMLPHSGNWKDSGTVKEAACLNNPVEIAPIVPSSDVSLAQKYCFVKLDNDNVVVTALKTSEAGENLILRVYESAGSASRVRVELGFAIIGVQEVDINENKVYADITSNKHSFEFDIGSYEIKTFTLITAGGIIA